MKMTLGQYKRLLLVASLPLLICGIIFSYNTSPHLKVADIWCYQLSPGNESCLTTFDSKMSEYQKSQNSTWFGVELPPPGKLEQWVYAKGTGRILYGVTVLGESSRGYPDAIAREMINLPGKSATIILAESGNESALIDELAILSCRNLEHVEEGNIYRSECFGDEWGAEITYRVSADDEVMLSDLISSITEERKRLDKQIVIHWVISTPVFIFLFLAISLLLWVLIKAYRYVKGE